MSARGLQVTMTPEGTLSIVDLDTLILAVRERVVKEVLHVEEAAELLGISKSTLYRIPKESLPYHYLKGLEGRLYLRSEIIEKIRKS